MTHSFGLTEGAYVLLVYWLPGFLAVAAYTVAWAMREERKGPPCSR